MFQRALRALVLTKEERSTLSNPSQWLKTALGATETDAGVTVSEESAMRLSAVYASVRVLAETVASLPLHLYKKEGRVRTLVTDHPAYKLLHDQPNTEMTSFQWREVMMTYIALWGNGYSQITRDRSGRLTGLWPISPTRVTPERDKAGNIRYKINKGASTVYLPADEMLHIPGLGFDGLVGLSPIGMARQAIGLSLAAEKFGSRFFGSGTNMGAVLKHPSTLSKAAQERLADQINERHKGGDKSHGVLILEEDMDIMNVSIPPEDSQFIETRKFQVSEIARIFRVPPHLIGDLDRSTYSNIEHQSMEFVQHTIRPWLVRWEQQLNMKLFRNSDIYPEFKVDGLLRGDIEGRYKAYATARQNGWMSPNEIRELENMNPLPPEIGDQYMTPKNMNTSNDKGEETA